MLTLILNSRRSIGQVVELPIPLNFDPYKRTVALKHFWQTTIFSIPTRRNCRVNTSACTGITSNNSRYCACLVLFETSRQNQKCKLASAEGVASEFFQRKRSVTSRDGLTMFVIPLVFATLWFCRPIKPVTNWV